MPSVKVELAPQKSLENLVGFDTWSQNHQLFQLLGALVRIRGVPKSSSGAETVENGILGVSRILSLPEEMFGLGAPRLLLLVVFPTYSLG